MPEDNIFKKEVPKDANPSVVKDVKPPDDTQKSEDKSTNPDEVSVDSKTPLNKVPRFQEIVKEKNENADRIAELEQELEDAKDASTQVPAEKTDSDSTPWFEAGSTQKPPNWPGVYKQIKEDAKKEVFIELSDAVRAERSRTQTEDTALDNDIKELRDTGDLNEKSEAGLLELHTDMYGNDPYKPGAIKKTYEFFKKMDTAKQEGSQEGKELEQRKQVAGKSTVGAGEGQPAKGLVGGYKKLRTTDIRTLAQEAAASLIRK